jgi:hypothetical protein
MAKGLFKLLLLGGLALGASGLPGLLGGLQGLSAGRAPAAALPSGSDESSRELRREMADLGRTMADLKALTGPVKTQHIGGLSAEERGLLKDAAPKIRFRNNALTRQLGLARSGAAGRVQLPGKAGQAAMVLNRLRSAKGPEFQSFGDFRDDLLRFYYGRQALMAWLLWAAPAGVLALAFLLLLFKRYTLSMLLTGWVFFAANMLLWGLSAAVVLSSVLTRQSLLPALPGELWLSAVVFLVVSVGLLRLADENYPFWNRTVTALFTPIAASAIAAFWMIIAVNIKGMMSGALGSVRGAAGS